MLGNSKAQNILPDAYDDMLGEVRSAISGGTTWDVEVITGTVFVIGALKNASTDMVQCKIQVPHRRKRFSLLASIHIHYVLQANNALNDTVVFTGKYVWIQPGDTIPADGSWIAFSGVGLTQDLGTVKTAPYYSIHNIQTNIACPAGVAEGYGGMLLISITRGNGTYTGKYGILDVDAHSVMNKIGSVNEISD